MPLKSCVFLPEDEIRCSTDVDAANDIARIEGLLSLVNVIKFHGIEKKERTIREGRRERGES